MATFLSGMVNAAGEHREMIVPAMSLYCMYKATQPSDAASTTNNAFGRAMREYFSSISKRQTNKGAEYVFDMDLLRQELIRRKTYDPDTVLCDGNDDLDDANRMPLPRPRCCAHTSKDVYSYVYT
jgi:hypothetical protein